MKKATDPLALWLSNEPVQGVLFPHNSYVRAVRGRHSGNSGSLVSLIKADSDPEYILESEAGPDLKVRQSEIEVANGAI